MTKPVDKEQANWCVPKQFYFQGISATKRFAKKTWKFFLRRATHVSFSKFGGWRRQTKTRGLNPRFAPLK